MSFQSFVWGNGKRTHKTPYLTLTSAGCWLSHGKVWGCYCSKTICKRVFRFRKVLTRLFKLWEEVMLFAHSSDKLYDRIHKIQIACKVGILGWYFQHSIISAWRCKERLTIFNVQDRIQVTPLRMELWCGRLDCREFDRFTTLKTAADFFIHPGESEGGSTVALFNQHLRDPHSQSGKIFPRIGCKLQKSILGQKSHIKQVSSQVSSREVDSLVDIDGTLKTTFREEGVTGF